MDFQLYKFYKEMYGGLFIYLVFIFLQNYLTLLKIYSMDSAISSQNFTVLLKSMCNFEY